MSLSDKSAAGNDNGTQGGTLRPPATSDNGRLCEEVQMERTRKLACLVTITCLMMFVPCSLPAEPVSKAKSRAALGIGPMKKLSVTLDVDKRDNVFEANERIKMKFVMKNESNTPIRVLIWGTPLEGLNSNLFDITGPDGEKIPYLGKIVSRPEPDPEKDYITIQPGKSITKEVDITDAYHIEKEGPYSLKHNFKMLDMKSSKGQGAAPEWRSRSAIELQPVPFKQKGIRQKTTRKSLQKAPPIRPAIRMYSQSQNQVAADLPPYTGTRKCNLKHIMLPDYETTDNDRKAELVEAFCEALKLAAEAKVTLNGTPGQEIESGADRYRAYFGDADKKDVLAVFGTIHTFGLPTQGSPVKFFDVTSEECHAVVEGAESQFIAFVMGDEILAKHKNIYLCPLFWTVNDSKGYPKSRTVLHEMAHLTRSAEYDTIPKPGYRARVWDYHYFESGCMYLAQNEPEHAAFNADSFALFALNRNDLHVGLDRPYVKLSKVSGKSLVVEDKVLRVRNNADPSKVQFAVSSPKESKLIYPSTVNNTCNDFSEFLKKCGNCDDPDAESANCDKEICSCVVQIDRNWKPFTPAFGDVVTLITGNRASVLDAPGTTEKAIGETEMTENSKGMKFVNAGAASRGLTDGADIYLQTIHGFYLSEADDGKIITKNVANPGAGERFSIYFSRQGKYYLQMRTESKGRYIRTREDILGRSITADVEVQNSADCADCTFILIKQNQEPLKSGDVINLMTYDGSFVYASNEKLWGFVRADGSGNSIPQSFIIQKVIPGDEYTIGTGDVVYLFSKAVDGNFPVWTSPEGKGQLYASDNPGVEERARKFIIELGR